MKHDTVEAISELIKGLDEFLDSLPPEYANEENYLRGKCKKVRDAIGKEVIE